MMSTDAITYARVSNAATNNSLKCGTSPNEVTYKQLDLSGRTELQYLITIDKSGSVTKFYATDGTYQMISKVSGLKIENIGKDGSGAIVQQIAESGVTEYTITCSSLTD